MKKNVGFVSFVKRTPRVPHTSSSKTTTWSGFGKASSYVSAHEFHTCYVSDMLLANARNARVFYHASTMPPRCGFVTKIKVETRNWIAVVANIWVVFVHDRKLLQYQGGFFFIYLENSCKLHLDWQDESNLLPLLKKVCLILVTRIQTLETSHLFSSSWLIVVVEYNMFLALA